MARARSRAAAPTMAALAVMGAGFVLSFAGPAGAATVQTSIALFDDDAGQALFAGGTLAPGHPTTQCLSAGATGAVAGDEVTLTAADVSGPLADNLQVTIEAGTGGQFRNCGSFAAARTVFQGSLTSLAGQTGVPTGWTPDSQADASFRITVIPGPASIQNETATGTFVWTLVSNGTPSPTNTTPAPTSPAPTSTAPTSPAPTPPAPTSAGTIPADPTSTDGLNPDVTSTAPTSSGSDSNSVAGTAASGGGSGAAPSSTGIEAASPPKDDTTQPLAGAGTRTEPDLMLQRPDTLAEQVRALANRTGNALGAVLTSPQYPTLAIATALGFLVLQDLVDRRDPKLAGGVTRLQRDNEITFPDLFPSPEPPQGERR